MNGVLLGIIGYVLLQLLFGFYVARKVRTEADYLLAGRKLGYALATLSIFGTWFGAETCIGTAGAAYAEGLAGVTADPFGYSICLIVMGLLLAVPFWKMKLTTVADFFRQRFSRGAERLTAILMVPTSVIWAAAQIRAFGQVLSASSELTLTAAIVIATTVVIIYTVSGGLLADAMTDFLQGIVLIIGLIVLAVIVVSHLGGMEAAVAAVPAAKLSFVSDEVHNSQWKYLHLFESWSIPICGSLVAQELVARVIASRSPQVARRSTLMASGMYITIGLMPLGIGLVGSSLLPGLENAEHILPRIAQEHLPTMLYVVFAGALVSAILSTVDSALLAATALLSHNVIIPMIPGMSEQSKVRLERIGVAVFGAVAFVMALYAEGVYHLVEEASSFGSAGIFTVVIIGIFTKFGGPRSAFAALAAGVLVWLCANYILAFEFSYTVSLAASFTSYFVMAFLERRSGPGRPLQTT